MSCITVEFRHGEVVKDEEYYLYVQFEEERWYNNLSIAVTLKQVAIERSYCQFI